jgi:putative hydrolase of the HAD superfamily
VAGAIVFDFYGTLAHWVDGAGINYAGVFADHGYDPPDSVLEEYFTLYDGVDHSEHSVSKDAYERWVRARLWRLAESGGVDARHMGEVVDALHTADQRPMVAYPEAAATLGAVRQAGFVVGVCSNWGWELNPFLEAIGLLGLVDCAITSARAGMRKPHSEIYLQTARSLDVDPRDVVFVGDSWEPDVRGPRRVGMTAIHVWRDDERGGLVAPGLHEGDYRVADLSGVLDVLDGLDLAGDLVEDAG